MTPTEACSFCGVDPHDDEQAGIHAYGWRAVELELDVTTTVITVCGRCTGLLKLIAPGLASAVDHLERSAS